MFRFSVVLVVALALVAATTIGISPVSAASGSAYDRCMAKCMKDSPKGNRCPYFCEHSNR